MKQAIFIDIDDTLLDFDAYVKQTLQSGFAHFGLKVYKPYMYNVFERINTALWHRIEQGALDFKALGEIRFNLVFEALGIEFDGVRFERYFRDCLWDSAILIDGSVQALAYLSEKYVVCAASNGPFAQQLHRLEIGGLKDYFDACFISEDIGASKPDKAFFVQALARLNEGREEPILPENCVIIGDSFTSDIAGGKNAGMQTIWFNRNHKKNMSGLIPDYEICTLFEIEKIL
ncbi:MAG: YjjG family noncanonical pyrimidine nucleotidase [Clostridia bacterium]|nr:YjjG family noncanonical pyrimidine nucleotidase [Clostridia bacterium]